MRRLVPLRHEGATEVERLILASAEGDPTSPHGRAKTLAALSALSATTMSAAPVAAAGKVAGGFLMKLCIVAGLVGGVATGTALVVHRASPPPPSRVTSGPLAIGSRASPVAPGASPRPGPVPNGGDPPVVASIPNGPPEPVRVGVAPPRMGGESRGPTAPPSVPRISNASGAPTPNMPQAVLRAGASAPSSAAPPIATAAEATTSELRTFPFGAQPTSSPAPAIASAASDSEPSAAVEPSSARSSPESLREEAALLERARAAVTRADTPGALGVLDAYDVRFPTGTLRPEAAVLRVQALLARGDRGAAVAATNAFARANPSSPYLSRLRALVRQQDVPSAPAASVREGARANP
jgi:hypothetical protein